MEATLQELKEIKELLRIIASNTEQKTVKIDIKTNQSSQQLHQLFDHKTPSKTEY